MKRNLRWFVRAVYERSYALIEKSVRDTGGFFFRKGVDLARSLGALPPPKNGEGILVVYLTSHFGDGIMLLPMLQALHDANPDTPIDLACSRGAEALFSSVPFLRRVYVAPLSSSPPLLLADVIRRRMAIVRWYRQELTDLHPQICLMPRWGDDLFGSLSLAYLIGSPVRVAYASTVDTSVRDARQRDRMITMAVEGGQAIHEPLRFLHVAQMGGLISSEITFTTDKPVPVLQQIAVGIPWEPLRDRLRLPNDAPFAVLAPGASRPNKIWPVENWIHVGKSLLAAGFHVVLLSGGADRAHAESIASSLADIRVHCVAGATSLPESICLLSHAAAFLGNDSGPGHAAGALGIPSVILFASLRNVFPDHPLSPTRIRPMGPYVRTLHPEIMLGRCRHACVTDEPHCISTIPARTVLDTLLELHRESLSR